MGGGGREKRQGRFAWAGSEGTKADSTEQLALDTQSRTSPQIDGIIIFILPKSWKKNPLTNPLRKKQEVMVTIRPPKESYLLFPSPNPVEWASQGPSQFPNLVFQLPHQLWGRLHTHVADS